MQHAGSFAGVRRTVSRHTVNRTRDETVYGWAFSERALSATSGQRELGLRIVTTRQRGACQVSEDFRVEVARA